MLERLTASPWLRTAVLVIVLAFCGYGLYVTWPQVTAGLGKLHWYSVALSLAATMGGAWCMMLAWRAILTDLGSKLPVRAAARVHFVAQLGKYVPGAVWTFAAQVELGHDLAVPRRRSVTSYLVAVVGTIAAGLAIAAAILPLSSPGLARHYRWVVIVVPVLALCVCPPVLRRVLDLALKLTRRAPLTDRLSWRGLAHALWWTLAGWLLLGIQIWVLLADITGRGPHVLAAAIGGYALAFSASLLLIIFPSGIGAREVILIAALAPAVPHGTAVAVALVSRVMGTFADLACGALGLALRKSAHAAVTRVTGRHRRLAA